MLIFRNSILTVIICFMASATFAEPISLLDFSTDTGECSAAVKKDLQEASAAETFETFKSYTLSETRIERRRGASPPTSKSIRPLQTLWCLAKDGNKVLVTSVEPTDSSCGWVREDQLQIVAPGQSLLGSSMEPCGEIEPINVGEFCSKINKMMNLSANAQKLTRFCEQTNLINATIDTKFVTDNTTSRLYSNQVTNELTSRAIELFVTSESDEVHNEIEIFSLNEVYDVAQTSQNGDVRILLGRQGKLKGWANLQAGHIWYSNLATYFSKGGDGKVYLGEVIGGNSDIREELAKKPSSANFNGDSDFVKFPVLFDMRKREQSSTPSFLPQLTIAFIGEFCDTDGSGTMCAVNDNGYNVSLSNLRSADVVFLIDGSKSMREYFEIVAESLSRFTDDYIGNPDYRFGVGMYGDYKRPDNTDLNDPLDFRIIRELEPIFSTSFENIANAELYIKDALKDKSEATHGAINAAAKMFSWDNNKPHFLIHIADHGDREQPSLQVVEQLLSKNIFYIPIAVEGEAVLKESRDFISQSKRYSEIYKNANGNKMAVPAIVTYGDGKKTARDAISDALVEATNIVGNIQENTQGSNNNMLAELTEAMKDTFNIRDDIKTLAAVGNIITSEIGEPEKDWDYFIALNRGELTELLREMEIACVNLGTGNSGSVATDVILKIVKILTGDEKTPQELARQLKEGSIPLQTKTIIGDGLTDLIVRSTTNEGIDEYKKEFCRTTKLLNNMLIGKKIQKPEDGFDIVWNGNSYDVTNALSYRWEVKDEIGSDIFYVPLAYMPRSLN